MRVITRKYPVPHPPYDISTIASPGADIIKNMTHARLHRKGAALTYIWFYYQVRNGGPWDYKQGRRQYENFGNFHYGAVGHAAGIPASILLRAAGAAQILAGTNSPEFKKYPINSYGDDPIDQVWIRAGIDYAKRSGF
ncbi:polymorphic toxin type 44 domain-containing protein [Serratia rubidaea]|nr:polymorphic toxin type 44 domain-containing protein [Serratia rubidaea]MDC6117966.1 polymorphic toxin type 44 domain-containing protein [Serratia rubidaea]